jgi:hypothetical protein
LLAVKQHPHGKILRNILETMGDMRGTEQNVARTNCGYRFLDSIMAASGGDEIEFIALMRDLRSVGGAGGEPHGRGDQVKGGGGPDPRELPPKGLRTRYIYTPDLHIDTIKVKARNFH